MDFCAWFYGVELDLLDFLLGGFGLFGEFGGACADAGVSVVDVVVEDFIGVVAWCCYASEFAFSLMLADELWLSNDLPFEEQAYTISTQ